MKPLRRHGVQDPRHVARTASTWPRTASACRELMTQLEHRAAGIRHWPLLRGGQGRSPTASAIRSWCGPPTCWAAGRMEIVYDEDELKQLRALRPSRSRRSDPVLIDKFLDDAIEVDVDAICDGEDVVIGGIMEHIEEAGVHSGRRRHGPAAPDHLARDHRQDRRDHQRGGHGASGHGPA
ncbi:MAG: hypothetical protein MZV65_46995 [Chromatiales bacterium]|nr:hypothetical protein [Chromatiales bacterium]